MIEFLSTKLQPLTTSLLSKYVLKKLDIDTEIRYQSTMFLIQYLYQVSYGTLITYPKNLSKLMFYNANQIPISKDLLENHAKLTQLTKSQSSAELIAQVDDQLDENLKYNQSIELCMWINQIILKMNAKTDYQIVEFLKPLLKPFEYHQYITLENPTFKTNLEQQIKTLKTANF